MDESILQMDQSILAVFGKPVIVRFIDETTLTTQGIIASEIVELGQYDAIQGEITVLHISSSIPLKRGATITNADELAYEVDRKLKDDGHLAKWNIYAH